MTEKNFFGSIISICDLTYIQNYRQEVIRPHELCIINYTLNCLACQVSILLNIQQKQREKTSLYTELYLNGLSDKSGDFIKPALTDLWE